MKLIEIIITAGIVVCLVVAIIALITFLAGGVEIMIGDIVDIILEAVGRIGHAWRGE